jgi:hypothetical protein
MPTFRPNAIYIHTRLAHLAKLTIITHIDKTCTLEYEHSKPYNTLHNNCELCEHCALYNSVVTPCKKFPKSLMCKSGQERVRRLAERRFFDAGFADELL